MESFALVTGMLFGAARQMNTVLFGTNYSSVTSSVIPSVGLSNGTVDFHSLAASTHDITTDSAAGVITTHIRVDITMATNVTSQNVTSERMVDSGVEIDTVLSAVTVRPQEITQESHMTGVTAATGHSSASQAAVTGSPNVAVAERQTEL